MKPQKESLAQTHPALAKEAYGWDPKTVVAGSHKKVNWKCKRSHTFEATIEVRSKLDTKCPVCDGKKILIGFNDLETLYPNLANQAFGWNPSKVGSLSTKRYEWKCAQKHIWKATISSRTKGLQRQCPRCFDEKVIKRGKTDLKTLFPTIAAEAIGWDPKKYSYKSAEKVNWQCPEGHSWECIIRDRIARGTSCPICAGKQVLAGFNDLRTTHPAIAKEASGWDPKKFQRNSKEKLKWKCPKGHFYESTVISRTHLKSNCPICSGNVLEPGKSDLASTHPKIAKELLEVDPQTIKAGSHKKFRWKCKKGHVYEATSHYRQQGGNCPVCSGRRIQVGFNDLATTNPEIAAFANGWDPTTLSAGSNKSCKWICPEKHEWIAPVYSLSNQGTRCPTCSGQQFKTGFNDLKTKFPTIAQEADGWDPTKIGPSSDKKVKWLCPNGHRYSALVYNRTFRSDQCPICAGKQVLAGFNDLATTHPSVASEAFGFDAKKYVAGSNARVKWKCLEGHVWSTSPAARTGSSSTGCPSCAKSGFDPNKDGWLYFLDHPTWELLQIGITNDPKTRLGKHKKLGWEVVEIRGPMDGLLTQGWETAMLRTLKHRGARLSPSDVAGKFDGYSEAWTKDSFLVKTIKELMAMVEEDDTHIKYRKR